MIVLWYVSSYLTCRYQPMIRILMGSNLQKFGYVKIWVVTEVVPYVVIDGIHSSISAVRFWLCPTMLKRDMQAFRLFEYVLVLRHYYNITGFWYKVVWLSKCKNSSVFTCSVVLQDTFDLKRVFQKKNQFGCYLLVEYSHAGLLDWSGYYFVITLGLDRAYFRLAGFTGAIRRRVGCCQDVWVHFDLPLCNLLFGLLLRVDQQIVRTCCYNYPRLILCCILWFIVCI